MLSSKKIMSRVALASVAIVTLTGCGPDSGETTNVFSEDFDIQYLRVNDETAVCYDDSSGSGGFCDFDSIEIPNGVEVIELTDDVTNSENWQLNYIVNSKNVTGDCLSHQSTLVDCNFGTESAKGSYGGDR